MSTKIARVAAVALTLAAGLALTGCLGGPSSVAAFERAQVAEDRAPTGILEQSGVAPESTRLLADVDGTSYFAGKMANSSNVCLIHSRADDDWGVTCSSGLPVTTSTSDGTEIMFAGGGSLPDANGWHFVADNIAVRDASAD